MLCPKTGEVVIKLAGGGEIRSGWVDGHDPDARPAGDYLKLLDADGREVMHMGADELALLPQQKIGEFVEACAAMQDAARDIESLTVKRILSRSDDRFEDEGTVGGILYVLGRYLDKCEAPDVVFEAGDGKFYVGLIQGRVDAADPDYVKELLAEEGNHAEEERGPPAVAAATEDAGAED